MKSQELKVAIYARVSTEAQEDEGQSLTTQLEMMRSAVARIGGTVIKEYAVQESAMPGGERPSLTAMLREAAQGLFDAVMVCKVDRLSRSIDVLRHVEASLSTFGVALFEGSEQQNLRSAEGRLNRGMQALIGEYSVNRLKWSAAASRLERAKRGWPHSGQLPFGRVVLNNQNRRSENAEWGLNDKANLVKKMYELYVVRGQTLAEVGRTLRMEPETVRRIMVNQSGGIWNRSFIDPATGEKIAVHTLIPRLLTEVQIARVKERTTQNQVERAGWANRKRDYPLSQYIRCSNPACGWSNLSGHLCRDYGKSGDSKKEPTIYSYYAHLWSKRVKGGECVGCIPADQIEDEIFSRLGQLLANAKDMTKAVRRALIVSPDKQQALENEEQQLRADLKRSKKILNNALEIMFEQRGMPSARLAQTKVEEQNKLIVQISERLKEVETELKVASIPDDFPAKYSQAMQRMVGLHGNAPVFWPIKAKRALLALFFGGKSTRFDRSERHKRSDQRGIFVSKIKDAEGCEYWKYEVRGCIADFTGALTNVVEIYERESEELVQNDFACEDLSLLSSIVSELDGFLSFRVSEPASRPWFATASRETWAGTTAGGCGHQGTKLQRPRV
jgi:site-specific DNA recombinase